VTVHELDTATALAHLAALITPIDQSETAQLADARERILGSEVLAAIDVPGFDNAAMDGYAVRAADCTATTQLQVIGRALAGHAFPGALHPFQAVRIMTGAPLPSGADAVVMQEDVRVYGDRVTMATQPIAGTNVRPRGEHLQRGCVVLTAGRRLRAYDVGLAAAAGVTEVTLVRRLRVGVLSTGDELNDPPQRLTTAGQYDGNRPMLIASLRRAGYDVSDLGIVADRADALAGALAGAAAARLDAVISSGGVAQGDADVVRRFPSVEFLPLAIRPGRGIATGRISLADQALWLFGLPGNSIAAYVMYQTLVAPLLARLAGGELESPLVVQLPLAADAVTAAGRIDWRRARFIRRYGGLAVEPLTQQSSSMLRTLSEADALVGIGPEPRTPTGTPVDVIPLCALP
jgi:molybdopterin molybdotransferase